MNTPSQQSKTHGAAMDADQTQPNPETPTFTQSKSRWDPELAADQVVHEITADDVIKAPVTQSHARDAVTDPLRAAKGDDDLMSQQRKH